MDTFKIFILFGLGLIVFIMIAGYNALNSKIDVKLDSSGIGWYCMEKYSFNYQGEVKDRCMRELAFRYTDIGRDICNEYNQVSFYIDRDNSDIIQFETLCE